MNLRIGAILLNASVDDDWGYLMVIREMCKVNTGI